MESTIHPIELFPLGEKNPVDRETGFSLSQQLLQEFVRLRYADENSDDAKYYIDQAINYFSSGIKVDWRTAGLVYYYSFLNFAKAYLIAKKATFSDFEFTFDSVKSSGLYHGLYSPKQTTESILDFEIEIYPPRSNSNGNYNIFSLFYNNIIAEWPYESAIKVKLKEILPYCHDITGELYDLYGLRPRVISLISLIRGNEEQVWFEVLASNESIDSTSSPAAIFAEEMGDWITDTVEFKDFNNTIKDDWQTTYKISPKSAAGKTIFQGGNVVVKDGDITSAMMELQSNVMEVFKDYCYPMPYIAREQRWLFIPKIELEGQKIPWHPLLSDYLLSFALSDILRYHPYMIMDNTEDQHISEAWCNQSALTVLRNLLMFFTNPPLRISRV